VSPSPLAALLLPLLLVPASGAGEVGAQWSPAERDGIALLRSLRDPSAPGPEDSGAALAALGPATLEVLFDVLEQRSVPGLDEGEGAQLLSRPQQETLLVALEALGRQAVLPVVEARLAVEGDGPGPSRAARRAGLVALGAVARGGELPRLLELAVDPVLETHDAQLDADLEDAVRRSALRDPRAFGVLAELARDLEPGALQPVLLGVGATRDPRGIEVLVELSMAEERVRTLAASQVPLLGAAPEPDWNRELARALQGDLDSGSRNLRVAALIALGELEDFDAVPAMIELLGDADPGLRSAAHRGLQRLLNRAASPSPGAWRHWYRVERDWLDREAPRLFGASRGADEAAAVAALEEIGRHRLERHRLALEAGLALTHPSAAVRLTACRVLTGLGSRWAAGDLRMALTDPDPAVAAAAGEALRAVTGLRGGNDPADWADATLPDPGAY
jgi:HEAT repeat protein